MYNHIMADDLRRRWAMSVGLVLAFVLSASTLVIPAHALRSGVVHKFSSYNEYSESISEGKTVFITAYKASWCGHCKKLAPVWERLAAALEDVPNVVVAEVECPSQKQICNEAGVKGFPTIKSVFAGEVKELYSGKRELASLEKFARSQGMLWSAETVQ